MIVNIETNKGKKITINNVYRIDETTNSFKEDFVNFRYEKDDSNPGDFMTNDEPEIGFYKKDLKSISVVFTR